MSTTLRVYLRSYTPVSQPQTEVVATARALAADGTVDDVDVSEWPASVSLAADTAAVRVHERIAEWARARDLDVTRPFRVHERTNPVTGDAEAVLHTPVVCVTLERDGELAGVAPCTLPDGTHLTARGFLASLDRDDDPLEADAVDALTA
jgi:hypothetical protein